MSSNGILSIDVCDILILEIFFVNIAAEITELLGSIASIYFTLLARYILHLAVPQPTSKMIEFSLIIFSLIKSKYSSPVIFKSLFVKLSNFCHSSPKDLTVSLSILFPT